MNAVRQLRSRNLWKARPATVAVEGDTKGESAASEHSPPLHRTNNFQLNNIQSAKSIRKFSYFASPYGSDFIYRTHVK